jgi:hypothetical protein
VGQNAKHGIIQVRPVIYICIATEIGTSGRVPAVGRTQTSNGNRLDKPLVNRVHSGAGSCVHVAIKRFEKEKDVMRILWMRKTGWLSDVNAKIRSPILEGIAKVHMPDNDTD